MKRHQSCEHLTIDTIWCHLDLITVGAIHFEDRFYASEKGGIGGGGWHIYVHMMLAWLAVEWPWLALAGRFLTVETTPLPV